MPDGMLPSSAAAKAIGVAGEPIAIYSPAPRTTSGIHTYLHHTASGRARAER